MWPFTRKRIVDDDTAAWHLENFTWLIEQFGGNGAFAKLKLVLPKPEYFTAGGKRDHAFAARIFDQVKAYCGMREWEADLVADDNPLAQRGEPSAFMVAPQKHALGTFAVTGNRIQISYVPAQQRLPGRSASLSQARLEAVCGGRAKPRLARGAARRPAPHSAGNRDGEGLAPLSLVEFHA